MTRQKLMVALKRVYDEPEPGDGTRVLVERLLASRVLQEARARRSLAQGNRAKQRIASMVWS